MILDTIRKKGVVSQLPGRFTLYDEEDGPCTDQAINKWIEIVKIPVIVVVSLAFASKRSSPSHITHALQLLTRTFRECTLRSELEMKVESYVGAASRMMNVFTSKSRDDMEINTFRLICSDECATRAEDLWGVLKDKYTVLIGGGKTVEDLHKLLTTSNVTNLGTSIFWCFDCNSRPKRCNLAGF